MKEQKDFSKIVTENKRPEYTPSKLHKKKQELEKSIIETQSK